MEDAMISRMAKGDVLASGFQLPHIWLSKTVTILSHFYSLGSTAPELVCFHWIFSLEGVGHFSLNIMQLIVCVFTPNLWFPNTISDQTKAAGSDIEQHGFSGL